MQWNLVTNVLISSFSAAGIVFVVLFLFSDYRLDLYRQELFYLRDQLFNIAIEAKVGFDHPAYRLLNLRINSLIRYAHKTTLKTLLLLALADLFHGEFSRAGNRSIRTLSSALEGLSRFQQFQLINLHNEVASAVFKRVCFFSMRPDYSKDLLPGANPVAQRVETQAVETYRLERLHHSSRKATLVG
jgi:hypothetical protein